MRESQYQLTANGTPVKHGTRSEIEEYVLTLPVNKDIFDAVMNGHGGTTLDGSRLYVGEFDNRHELSRAIQEANEGWNNNRERALYDAEDFLSSLIEAADEIESTDCAKHPRVQAMLREIDSFIESERSENRIAEKIAALDKYDQEWHNRFWYGHPEGIFGLAKELHAKHQLQ